MKLNALKISLSMLAISLLIGSCVQKFDGTFPLDLNLVVVNGIITNQAGPQTISLSRSRANQDSASVTTPISQARVEVVVDSSVTLSLREVQPGVYQLPDGFRGRVGHSYQLRFQTVAGATYQSSVEVMAAVPPIGRVYSQYNPTGPKPTANALPAPANDIYLDYQDPANARNFYLWRWRLYEIQAWCATCQQGRYVIRDVGPVGAGPIEVLGCVQDTTLNTYNFFDYPCNNICWEIFYNSDVTVASDVLTNGQPQTGQKIASIPIYQLNPALIVVEQLSLSANAYRYYKLFAEQTQNTGTLADAPPAPLAGNIKNPANPAENVVGYFSAASVAVQSHKMLRKDVPTSAGRFQGLFYAQNGRNPNLETRRPPFFGNSSSAICIPGRYRTDQLPPGWNE